MIPPALLGIVVLFAGLLGLVIGSFLNVVIARVPEGIPLTRESRCPTCDAPIRAWQNVPLVSWLALRGRCASCRTRISARYPLVELVTGIAFALITWYLLSALPFTVAAPPADGWQLAIVVVAYLYFAAVSIALTAIDLDTRRLPNGIVLPSYLVSGALLTAASALSGDWSALARAAIGGAALFAFYFLLRVIRPAGMGGGDVKLAGLIGINLAWLGWGTLVVGAFAAFLLGGVFGIILLLARRAGRKTAIPFGPWMIAGAWVGIAAGEPIARWYTELLPTP